MVRRYDPVAVYPTMAACIADSCNVMPPTASWDCAPNTQAGCYDPGTGLGQYTSLAVCQAVLAVCKAVRGQM